MDDITELAQRARINAECSEHLSPAETLELVDALEKSQRYIERLREWNAGLAQESCERQQRIAELQSRTVKLPKRYSMLLREDFNEDYRTEMAFKAEEVQASLAAAGVKVEAE